MEITIYGARGSEPVCGKEFVRYGGDTTCVSVRSAGKLFIIDAGTGIRNIDNIVENEITILLTHTHWDHIQGLPFFGPAFDPQKKIVIYGGNNLRLQEALENQHHDDNSPIPFTYQIGIKNINSFVPGEEIYNDSSISIATLLQNHPRNGSIGYKFSENNSQKNKVFVFCTDFESGNQEFDYKIINFWQSADLVIADVQYEPRNSTLSVNPFRKNWGHSDYQSDIFFATIAGARRLAGIHFDPKSCENYLDGMETRMREEAEKAANLFKRDMVQAELVKQGLVYKL